ncbi:MAG TPA: lipopolysaccharide biosynthesis protein [Armatimonadota bacterium]
MPHANDVGRMARRGALWAGVTVIGHQIIALATSIVLARLLSPTAYGINTMAMTLTVFLTFVSDAGLSMVTLQRRNLSKQQVDNLFWINVGVGLLMWLICAASGPILARFYSQPELIRVMPIVGFTFVVGGFAVQPIALMRRNIQQREVAIQQGVASLSFAGVGIGLAMMKFSYWALVYQAVAYGCVRAAMAFIQSGYRPGPWRRDADTHSLLKFGGAMCVSAALVYLSRNLDNILIGHYWRAEVLGYYSRAYILMMAPTFVIASTLGDVMVPTLSALRDNPERMGAAYRRTMRMIAFVGCPISLWLALAAPQVIQLMYGTKWSPVAPMLMWLSLAGVLHPLYSTTAWLFTVVGDLRRMLFWNFASTGILAITFLVAVPHGATVLAAAYAVVMTVVLATPGLGVAHKAAGLPLDQTLRAVAPIVGGAVGAASIAVAVGLLARRLGIPEVAVVLVKTIVALGAYTAWSLWKLRPLPVEKLEALVRTWTAARETA